MFKVTLNTQLFKTYMLWVANLGQSMHYIQAWKIFTTRSADDISITAYTVCLILLIHWLLYGIMINDRIIILAETLGIVGTILVLFGAALYS